MILKFWSGARRVKLALLVAVPLGIYWVLAAQMSWRSRTLIDLGKHAQVWSQSLSSDGKRIVLVSTNSSSLVAEPLLSVWTRDGKFMWRSRPAYAAFFMRDGKTVMSYDDMRKKLDLRDARTGRLQKTWDLDLVIENSERALSPDGKMLACGGEGSTTSVYDLSRVGQGRLPLLHRFAFAQAQSVRAVGFSSDSRTLASAVSRFQGARKIFEIQLWDTRTWRLKRAIESGPNNLCSVAFSANGAVLASVDYGGTKLWNPRSGKLLRSLDTGNAVIGLSPDGKVLASSDVLASDSQRNIKLWDVRTGALLRELAGHRRNITEIAFSPDGATLLSASNDGTVREWRIK